MQKLTLVIIATLLSITLKANNTGSIKSHIPLPVLNVQNITPPKFPGGKKAFTEFLIKNLQWPKTGDDVTGTVYLSFYVEKDGRLTNIKIEKSLHPAFDQEALTTIKKSPKWIAATKNGKATRFKTIVPIRFNLIA
jgi:protein TonB